MYLATSDQVFADPGPPLPVPVSVTRGRHTHSPHTALRSEKENGCTSRLFPTNLHIISDRTRCFSNAVAQCLCQWGRPSARGLVHLARGSHRATASPSMAMRAHTPSDSTRTGADGTASRRRLSSCLRGKLRCPCTHPTGDTLDFAVHRPRYCRSMSVCCSQRPVRCSRRLKKIDDDWSVDESLFNGFSIYACPRHALGHKSTQASAPPGAHGHAARQSSSSCRALAAGPLPLAVCRAYAAL